MLQVTVALPSGQGDTFSLQSSSKVGALKVLAQKSFQRGFLRLVAADHSEVDPTLSLQAAGLQDGDHLTAIAVEAKLAATNAAFALFCSGGDRVVAWGNPRYGSDSSEVPDQLKSVQQVQASFGAFAAILGDGSVVTWGAPNLGGDRSAVQDQLKSVRQVQASGNAFAAILADGSVVTWGAPDSGGDSSEVQDRFKSVQQVQATLAGAFAAILADGSVVTWGNADAGGDSSEVQDQLKGVQQVQANLSAFAAILADGSVVTWGHPDYGGDSSEVQDRLKGVQQVQATPDAFAAILVDGSVVTWGAPDYGGDSYEVQDQLKGVQQVQGTLGGLNLAGAFAAILADGSLVTWGKSGSGGNSFEVQEQLKGVQQVRATSGAFAAILEDGSVVTWGAPNLGGDSSAVQDQLKGVQQVQANLSAFAAILADGSVVTWGAPDSGGDSSEVQDRLKGVQQVQATEGAFAAILADGSVVTWGSPDSGGDSSACLAQFAYAHDLALDRTWALTRLFLVSAVFHWLHAKNQRVYAREFDDRHMEMRDYSLLVDGFPEEATSEKAVAEYLQAAVTEYRNANGGSTSRLPEVVGASICFDYHEDAKYIGELIEAEQLRLSAQYGEIKHASPRGHNSYDSWSAAVHEVRLAWCDGMDVRELASPSHEFRPGSVTVSENGHESSSEDSCSSWSPSSETEPLDSVEAWQEAKQRLGKLPNSGRVIVVFRYPVNDEESCGQLQEAVNARPFDTWFGRAFWCLRLGIYIPRLKDVQ
eukprot:s671_g12.t1